MTSGLKKIENCVVVGGSLAGLTAGWQAAKRGAQVTILERKKEIGKPVRCGEGTCLEVLKAFELSSGDWVLNPVKWIDYHAPGSKPVHINGERLNMVIIDRPLLEQELARRAKQEGADIIQQVSVTGIKGDTLTLDNNNHIKTDIIIDASGVEATIGRAIGLIGPISIKDLGMAVTYKVEGNGWERNTAEVHMGSDVIPRGYAWLFPINEKKANVGIGFMNNDADERRTLFPRLDAFMELHFPGCKIIEKGAGAVPVCLPPSSAVRGNIMLIGDAARHSYAVGGGGIHSALFDGFIAGNMAGIAVKKQDMDYIKRYDGLWKEASFKALERSYRMKHRIFTDDKGMARSCKLVRALKPLIHAMPKRVLAFWWGKQERVIKQVRNM